jgi:hypothetical protein
MSEPTTPSDAPRTATGHTIYTESQPDGLLSVRCECGRFSLTVDDTADARTAATAAKNAHRAAVGGAPVLPDCFAPAD